LQPALLGYPKLSSKKRKKLDSKGMKNQVNILFRKRKRAAFVFGANQIRSLMVRRFVIE